MNKKSYLHFAFLFVGLILMLTNCSTVNREQTTQISDHMPFVESADTYLSKADSASSEEKNELKIMAAGRLIYDRHIQDGVKILKQLSLRHSILADEKYLLMAKANLMVNNPKRASFYLSRVKNKTLLPLFYQSLYRQLLIDSYEQRGRLLEAVHERIKLDNYIQNKGEKVANDKQIWLDLIHMPLAELQTLAIEANDPVVQGWASLAAMAQQPNSKVSINQWQRKFPDHEANQILYPEQNRLPLSQRAKKIALLLPMTGALSGPGHAIRDGFIDAKSQEHRSISFRIYNVAQGSVLEHYRQAIQDGADMVIGPLLKEHVDIIARQQHPVPTLLLNYTTSNVLPNAWEFGLSPTQEASQLADKLAEQGFKHAIVISPKGSWENKFPQLLIKDGSNMEIVLLIS